MATIKYASLETLTAFATQVKNLLGNKVDKQDGYSLTKNDLTDTLKSQYDAAYTHSQSAHAPSDAERNTIVSISVNGSDVAPDGSRKVALTVPTKVSDLTNDSGFQTASDVSGAITTALENYTDSSDMQAAIAEAVASAGHLKRTVVADLPEADQDADTIYMIKDQEGGTDQYTEYMWINGAWETIGSTRVDLSDYVTSESLTSTLANYVLAADMVAITSTEVEGLFA